MTRYKITYFLTVIFPAIFFIFASGACSPVDNTTTHRPFQLIQPTDGLTGSDWHAIFSTEPAPDTHTFFIVQLDLPPALSALVIEKDGSSHTDPKLLEAIGKQQDAVIQKLQSLSSDIKIIYRYRMVLNGLAVVTPAEFVDSIAKLTGVAYVESAGAFTMPVPPSKAEPVLQQKSVQKAVTKSFAQRNSVKFIGGTEAHQMGLLGQGIKIGIIDTGIDYTHKIFGGEGTEDAYKAIKPSEPTPAFPNKKIVGGIDLVGTHYDSGSIKFANRVPVMDSNPIDESGHGSHVAGTVAGVAYDDESYDGVAPDAELYALKVFGANGSTSDTVVIAAMEYAADPNGDGNFDDRLDVLNLSLGSGYGTSHILYGKAIQNLTAGNISVVTSGGNSGDLPYIVGTPGVTDEALSTAASIDDMDHNWKFPAIKFETAAEPEIYFEAIEGATTKPLNESKDIEAALVYIGLANKELSDETKTELKGKIALIDRGLVSFVEKIQRAEDAGAIGVVMVNSEDGPAIVMGGDDSKKQKIPGVMITKELGEKLKSSMQLGDVIANLTTETLIEKPELIDTITSFSSRGPRSIDGALKPEIAAPGEQIVSAKMGSGDKTVKMNGTSMSAPHMTGVIALLKQKLPALKPLELKALAMQTAKTLSETKDGKTTILPMSRQGAGRVQIMKALMSTAVAAPSALSLGEIAVETKKIFAREVSIRNLDTAHEATFTISLQNPTPGIELTQGPKEITVPAGETKKFSVRLALSAAKDLSEVSAYLAFIKTSDVNTANSQSEPMLRVPIFAVIRSAASIRGSQLLVRSTAAHDSQGAVVDLTLQNQSQVAGSVLPFNKIGQDRRKGDANLNPFQSRICDLESSGYRVVNKDGDETLQIAVKLYEPTTTWDLCQISVLIDSDHDHTPDQEIAGVRMKYVAGLAGETYASVLLDTKQAQIIRQKYDAEMRKPTPSPTPSPAPTPPSLNFAPAIEALEPMTAFNNSTIAIVEAPVGALKLSRDGTLAVRIATSAQASSAVESDDFLNKDPKKWRSINLRKLGAAFTELPLSIELQAGETKAVSFTKGAGKEDLLLLMPNGSPLWDAIKSDNQSQTMRPVYRID